MFQISSGVVSENFQSSLCDSEVRWGRVEDFDEFFHAVLREVSQDCGKVVHRIDERAADLLEMYAWPKDERELREVLTWSVRSMRKNVITAQDLPLSFILKLLPIKESS